MRTVRRSAGRRARQGRSSCHDDDLHGVGRNRRRRWRGRPSPSSATETRVGRGRSTSATAGWRAVVCVRRDDTRAHGDRRRLRRRSISKPRTTPTIVCVLVPDDVIPSLPLRGRSPTGARSWRAATRSRSTGSWSPAISGWSRRACSVRRSARCYEEGVGFITAVGVDRDAHRPRAWPACSAIAQGDRRPAPGRDRAHAARRKRCSTSASSRCSRPR